MKRYLCSGLTALAAVSSLLIFHPSCSAAEKDNWQAILKARLPSFGHRNWIIITDAAYPDQSSGGIETVVSDADQLVVLKELLSDIDRSKHIRPIVYEDSELAFLNDRDAPGVSAYREKRKQVLASYPASASLHENLIAKLDAESKVFKVLVIKTNLTIPYTTVFVRLDCAYWTADQEKRLRTSMESLR